VRSNPTVRPCPETKSPLKSTNDFVSEGGKVLLKTNKNTKELRFDWLVLLFRCRTLSQLEVVVGELNRHVLDAVQQLIHKLGTEVLVVGEDVRAITIFAWEVGGATHDLAANLRFHVHGGDVAVQVILRHVLVAAVLALIFLDI
jgi:hypothetical protein